MNTQEVLEFLKSTDPAVAAKVEAEIAKSSPGVGDVHQPSASDGRPGKRRRKKPAATVAGGEPDPHKEGSATAGAAKRKPLAFDVEQLAKETDANMLDKTAVDYTDNATGADHCAMCQHMVGQDACEIVKGVIRPGGWCKEFADRFAEEQAPQVAKKDGPRQLKLMDDTAYAHTPFPWDANALANLTPEQVPAFLAAITKPQNLPVREVKLRKLTAIQDRVDVGKVKMFQDAASAKPPVVAKVAKGQFIIGDGHHRLTAAWLNGEKRADVSFVDRSDDVDVSEGDVDKNDWGVPFEVKKVDPDQRLIFGFCSTVEIDGKLVLDKQDDVMLPDELEKAVYDFVLFAQQPNDQDVEKYLLELDPRLGAAFRAIVDDVGVAKRATMGFMHEKMGMGRVVETMMFTQEKLAVLDKFAKEHGGSCDMKMQGWWIGFKVDNDEVWALAKEGKLPEFSIGGRGRRVAV